MSAADAAVADFSFLFVGPAAAGDVLTGQVDDDVETFQSVRCNFILIGVPFDLAGLGC